MGFRQFHGQASLCPYGRTRFNLEKEPDRTAWEHLQQRDKQEHRSYSKTVIAAVNDYFNRRGRLMADPYLETREKEDALDFVDGF